MKNIIIPSCLIAVLTACTGQETPANSSTSAQMLSSSAQSSSVTAISSSSIMPVMSSSSSAQSSASPIVNACDSIDKNLALHRSALASSLDPNITDGKARDALDGNLMTRWSSAYEDNQWLQVDLGASALLCRIDLQWEAAYPSEYRILTSDDGQSWLPAVIETASNGGKDQANFPKDTVARYVRILSQKRATNWGISLWEVSIMGDYQGLPVAAWSLSGQASTDTQYSLVEGTTGSLDASASFDNDGMITGYDWRDINGTWTANGARVNFPAKGLGDHKIQLTVTDNDGNQNTAQGTIAVTAAVVEGNPVCKRAYFCEGFENGFGSARKIGNRGSIDTTQGANGSRAAFHYNTDQSGGNAWVEFANTAFNSAPELWVSYYQKVTKTPVPTNWFALIHSAASEFPAFRLGSQKYAETVGANGVLGNWSCWNGHPCPTGFPAGYDKSVDPTGGRRPLPNNQWVCIEIQLKKGPIVSVYMTPSIRSDIPDGGAYIRDSAAPGQFSIGVVKLGYNPQSDSLEGWVDDVIIASERPGCTR